MTNHKKTWILFLIASVSLVVTLSANDVYAFHEPETQTDEHSEDKSHDVTSDANPNPSVNGTMMAYPTVHDMSLVVIYDSTQGVLHSQDFTYYSQLSGFDRSKVYADGVQTQTKPSFIIEGIVTPNNRLLYDMVDYIWEMQDFGYVNLYHQSDFYIGLMQDEKPVRVFKYVGCKITDYKVDTLYDGLFTYDPNGGSGRAFVDKFTFECDGYKPLNEKKILESKEKIMSKLEKQHNMIKSGNGFPIKEIKPHSMSISQVLPQKEYSHE